MTNTLKSGFRFLAVLAILATSIQVAPTASAVSMGSVYDGTSGDVACLTLGEPTGYFSIINNVATRAFSCTGAVVIPSGVVSIADNAFAGDDGNDINSLVISNTVTSIGVNAFKFNNGLTSLTIPGNVREVGGYAFYSSGNLETLTIENGVTSIGFLAFRNSTRLTAVILPNSVTSVGEYAFSYLTSLTELRISSNLTTLGGSAFADLTSLSIYSYCGTTISEQNFADAGLSTKTRTCADSAPSESSSSNVTRDAAVVAAIAQREAEVRTARADIVEVFKSSKAATAESFAQADIRGITKSNIDDVNAEIALLPVDSRTSITEIVKIARKYEVVGNIASEQVGRVLPAALVEIGLISAESKNKVELVSAVRRLNPEDRSTYGAIKSAIDAEMKRIQMRKDRLAAIIARISGGSGK